MTPSPRSISYLAAKKAGLLAKEYFRTDLVFEEKSGPNDLVSIADKDAEKIIRSTILQAFPQDSFLGEESGSKVGSSNRRWIVDPIDGTNNFLAGLAQWTVCVACKEKDRNIAAALYDPVANELLSGDPNSGLYLGRRKFERRGRERNLNQALLLCQLPRNIETDKRWIKDIGIVHQTGSTAWSLLQLALGRADLYYQRGGLEWDWAAGIILCEIAGLTIVELPIDDRPRGFLIGPDRLIKELLEGDFKHTL